VPTSPVDAAAFAGAQRYSVFYQPTGDDHSTARPAASRGRTASPNFCANLDSG